MRVTMRNGALAFAGRVVHLQSNLEIEIESDIRFPPCPFQTP